MEAVSRAVSVVPISTRPCHGIANSTRLSAVRGMMTALVPGKTTGASTRCAPWLGATTGAASRIVQVPYRVGEDPGGIDYYPGPEFILPSRFLVAGTYPGRQPTRLQQSGHLQVVERRSSQVGKGPGQSHGQPGVVELGVVVGYAAPQSFRLDGRGAVRGFVPG